LALEVAGQAVMQAAAVGVVTKSQLQYPALGEAAVAAALEMPLRTAEAAVVGLASLGKEQMGRLVALMLAVVVVVALAATTAPLLAQMRAQRAACMAAEAAAQMMTVRLALLARKASCVFFGAQAVPSPQLT
jgi:hypothetical protein